MAATRIAGIFEWPAKDPDEVLDYLVDWRRRLNGDTIVASTWEIPPGITKDCDSMTATTSTVWLSGGASGETYLLVNRVVTNAGRTYDESFQLPVVSPSPVTASSSPTLADLQDYRGKLVKARSSGLARVSVQSPATRREMEFRSDAELAAALADVDRQIAALNGGSVVQVVNIRNSRGWS